MLLLCILSFLLHSMNADFNGISASIKNDINLEPTAKWQRRRNCLPRVDQVFPRLWKRKRRTSLSLWKGQLELLRSKTDFGLGCHPLPHTAQHPSLTPDTSSSLSSHTDSETRAFPINLSGRAMYYFPAPESFKNQQISATCLAC